MTKNKPPRARNDHTVDLPYDLYDEKMREYLLQLRTEWKIAYHLVNGTKQLNSKLDNAEKFKRYRIGFSQLKRALHTLENIGAMLQEFKLEANLRAIMAGNRLQPKDPSTEHSLKELKKEAEMEDELYAAQAQRARDRLYQRTGNTQ